MQSCSELVLGVLLVATLWINCYGDMEEQNINLRPKQQINAGELYFAVGIKIFSVMETD